MPIKRRCGSGRRSRSRRAGRALATSRARRDGLELGPDWIATERPTVAAAWAWPDYRFERFSDRDGNDCAGNRLPGLPEHRRCPEADRQAADGRYTRAAARHRVSARVSNASRVEAASRGIHDQR